jgi:N-carbamoylputrescine amidase
MTNAAKTKIALIQMRCGPEPDDNFSRAIEFIRESAQKGAQIVCLPELFRSQYFCQTEDHKNFDLAEEVPGKSTSALAEVARETGAIIIASLFEKRSAGVYHNTAAIIDGNGKLLGKYRKMHIPDDPLYHEKFYFAPGDLGFQAWPTPQGKIGVCVCWDQWYPEAARLTALHGAEIIFYPTAIGWHPPKRRSSARRNMAHGKPSSAVTQSRTDAMLRSRTASVMKRLQAAMALNFGDKALFADRTAKSSQRVPSTGKRL